MRDPVRWKALVLGASLAATLGALVAPRGASACGMFVPALGDLLNKLPKLAVEQVLIVHDAEAKTEHFIREIRVDRGSSDFGFVVPVPSRPEVARVDKEPFKALRDKFPFTDPNAPRSKGGPPGSAGAPVEGAGGGVTVLSEQQIGSFKAFVLSATSGGGLERWLAENRFAAPEIARSWIEHYVQSGFFFVAFRYDAPKGASSAGITGETVRISFPTPVPYYPYLEPRHATRPRAPRVLAVWFVAKERMHPLVSETNDRGVPGITSPWRAGASYDKTRAKLAQTIGPELAKLLPKGELVVETFQDLRTDRSGFGDVLFAPDQPAKVDEAWKKERARFLALLDPALESGDGPKAPVSVVGGAYASEGDDE